MLRQGAGARRQDGSLVLGSPLPSRLLALLLGLLAPPVGLHYARAHLLGYASALLFALLGLLALISPTHGVPLLAVLVVSSGLGAAL
jgi:hypothetical protein